MDGNVNFSPTSNFFCVFILPLSCHPSKIEPVGEKSLAERAKQELESAVKAAMTEAPEAAAPAPKGGKPFQV